MGWDARSPRRRRTIAALALVLACHGVLIALLNASGWRHAQRSASSLPPQRVTLRLIAPTTTLSTPTTPPAVQAAAPRATAPTVRDPLPRTPRIDQPKRTERSAAPRVGTAITATPSHAETAPADAPAAATAAAFAAPSPPASAPDTRPSLMDAEATRRAIRESARAASLGDQLAQSREEPRRLSANDRLAIGVRQAGKGDCLKGQYMGAGMGLLSLPFLAVAAAAGNCAK
jgi:hypothetical protein